MKDLQKAIYSLFNGVVITKGDHTIKLEDLKQPFLINTPIVDVNTELWLGAVDALKDNVISDGELTRSLYASWERLKEDNEKGLVEINQFVGYLNNYFLNSLHQVGETTDNSELEDNPLVVRTLSLEELYKGVIKLISMDVALDTKDVTTIMDFLVKSNYSFKDIKIGNRELKLYLKLNKIIPLDNAEDIIKLLSYVATGNAMFVKNDKTFEVFKEFVKGKPKETLKFLNEFADIEHSEIFNRYKKFYIAMKIDKVLKAKINRISKLSKKNHKPMEIKLIDTVLNYHLTNDELSTLFKDTKTTILIRILNGVIYRKNLLKDNLPLTYSIRTGSLWTKENSSYSDKNRLDNLETMLTRCINIRMKKTFESKGIYVDKYDIDLAIPTSGKKMLSNIPYGSVVTPNIDGDLVVGLHWYNVLIDSYEEDVDLDLHCVTHDINVGYGGYYNKDNIWYSGDVMSAPLPHGANEFMRVSNLDLPLMVTLNLFNARDNFKYKLFIGSVDEQLNEQQLIDPKSIVFSKEIEAKNVMDSLGVIDTDNKFVFGQFSVHSGKVPNVEDEKVYLSKYYKLLSVVKFSDLELPLDGEIPLSSLSAKELLELVSGDKL